MERCRLWTEIGGPDSNEGFEFVVIVLGVLDEDVPVSILVKDACIEEFILAGFSTKVLIFLDELVVGEFGLRIFVEEFHV